MMGVMLEHESGAKYGPFRYNLEVTPNRCFYHIFLSVGELPVSSFMLRELGFRVREVDESVTITKEQLTSAVLAALKPIDARKGYTSFEGALWNELKGVAR